MQMIPFQILKFAAAKTFVEVYRQTKSNTCIQETNILSKFWNMPKCLVLKYLFVYRQRGITESNFVVKVFLMLLGN